MVTGDQVADLFLSQEGDEYEWGVKPDPSDPDPEEGDCSGYVAWAVNRLGVSPKMPQGSWYQFEHCRKHGTVIPLDDAIDTRGAILYRKGHIAISLGNGHTIEAKGEKWGVVEDKARGRFTHGCLIPGVKYPEEVEV